jgi:hypothetical protein
MKWRSVITALWRNQESHGVTDNRILSLSVEFSYDCIVYTRGLIGFAC